MGRVEIEKEVSGGNLFKIQIIASGNINDLFDFDNNTILPEIENKIKAITRPGKIKRCFNCQSCGKPRTLRQMSAYINLCRECLSEAKSKGQIAQSNFINRAVNNFLKSIRAEVMQ